MGKPIFISRLLLASFALLKFPITQPAWGRDPDEPYKDSPLHDWFEHLASRSLTGYIVQGADWESCDGHYCVRVPKEAAHPDDGIWVDVPDEAVITEPNGAGRTMVWPSYTQKGASIRCFMPGSMT